MKEDRLHISAVWNFLVRDFRWKLFAVTVASIVYFSIRAQINDLRTVSIPVVVDQEVSEANVRDGAVVESFDPQFVQVTVRGSFNDVNLLNPDSACCTLRPRYKKGAIGAEDSIVEKIRKSSFRGIASSLKIVKIEPEECSFRFDYPMSMSMPIAPVITEGKARGRVEITPAFTNATVSGSRRLLRALDRTTAMVQVQPISVEGRATSFTVPVKLLPPADVPNATVSPATMEVSVKIVTESVSRHMERGRVRVIHPPNSSVRWQVEPEFVDYDVRGRIDAVNSIRNGQILFSVDADLAVVSGSVTTNEAPVRAHVLQGLQVDDVSVMPPVVKLIAVPPENGERK